MHVMPVLYIINRQTIKEQHARENHRAREVIGMRNMCTRCGMAIFKSALADAYLCRMCERTMSTEELYAHFDMR